MFEYKYRFKLDKVHDGDTIYGWVDRGFGTLSYKKIRMFGIQAPEIKTKGLAEKKQGLYVREWLSEKLEGKTIVLQTYKDKTGKYGRVLAEVYADDEHIQSTMLKEKLVKVYE